MPPSPPAPRASPPSADLPPDVARLAARGVQRRFRARTLLIQEGEGGDAIYIVLAGRLRAFVSDARGREVTLGHHGPGEYVGEMSLDGGPRSASFACTATSLAAGASVDFAVKVNARPTPAGGLITVQGSATSPTPDANPADNQAQFGTSVQ